MNEHASIPSAAVPPARVRVAPVLALVALVAALAGALGPAERVRTSYAWPPATLPAGDPERTWYSPLLLMRHVPETLTARIPCDLPTALPGAGAPLTVLATARRPEDVDGLALRAHDGRLRVSHGDEVLDEVALSGSQSVPECAYRLRLGKDRWSLEGGPRGVSSEGSLDRMPRVTGLFSSLDLRGRNTPTIEVTTTVHATRTIARQAFAWSLAGIAIAVALVLVAFEPGRPRRRGKIRRGLGTIRRAAHPVDAAVGIVLLAWWVLSPAFFDDGWIFAKQSMFSVSRGFSTYFVMFGTNAPLGYWLDWLQHWLTQSTTLLVFLRAPALVALASTWVLCRYVLARVLAPGARESSLAVWGLASAFLVGAVAWGMTLRPEPVVALLVMGVFACMIRFRDDRSPAPLAIATVLVPLAVAAHPSGLVALAPVLAVGPTLVRWVVGHRRVAATLVIASAALFTVLAFVGSDLAQRRSDTAAIRSYGGIVGWHDELMRYELLSAFPYGTPARRLTVALGALAMLGFAFQLLRGRRGPANVPAVALGLATLLLVAAPSKWPWHFGTLLGLLAVAVGTETVAVRHDQRGARRWHAWPFVAVAAAVLAGAWAWGTRAAWNLADLRTLDWNLGFERRISLPDAAIVLPVLLTAGAILVAVLRRRGDARYEQPARIASWTAPLLAVPIIAFTGGVLLADTGKTHSWTLARENANALVGKPGCGLADDLGVPDLGSARTVSREASGTRSLRSTVLPPPPLAGLEAHRLSAPPGTTSRTPWFRLPAREEFGLFVAGVPEPSGRLALEWGRDLEGRVHPLGRDPISSVIVELPAMSMWQLYVAGEIPRSAAEATLVRVVRRSPGPGPAPPMAVTAPVTYSTGMLAERLTPNVRTLVHPDLLPYVPCARLPRIANGVAEPPRYVVAAGHPALPREYAHSPVDGLADLFEVRRLSTADSENPQERIFVYTFEPPAGARLARPVASTLVS